MFKKLRNRFLLLNLIIITILMAFSFTTIYMITYNNVYTAIKRELTVASELRLRGDKHVNPNLNPDPNGNPAGNGLLNPGKQANKPDDGGKEHPPEFERSVSFSIVTDADWNTLNILSYLNLEDTFYSTAKGEALKNHSDTGVFKMNESSWMFIKKPYGQGHSITFLNITSQQAILTNLIYTFSIVALVMFLFIFLISRYFADRSIKPIKLAFEKQKQFIADSSHELKTPLAVISTNVDVLLANKDNSIRSQEKWLNYIKSETERMTKLTNDLLYLTRMENAESQLLFSEFNFSDTIVNVILTMEAVVFENNLAIDYEKITPNVMVNGNSDQLQQVVMILLDNAIKYTNPQGSISVSLQKQHHRVLLSITNTGEGIPPEHLDKIFDRFYRTDKSRSRKSGGYGLGLAIAKAIVEQHGGEIHAQSTVNEKTTFTVELPMA
ncbi:MAG: HAMP domain-containing histidine kinase [Clostridia bacterium]|nr:HAMP domain-containing histidine kinase [Clostridia bacterium]